LAGQIAGSAADEHVNPLAHGVHEVALVLVWNDPTTHAKHCVVVMAKEPEPHVVHVPDSCAEVVPVGHTSAAVAPCGQYEPAGHVMHEEDPLVGRKRPAGHTVQAPTEPVEKRPGGHNVGTTAPVPQNEPDGHGVATVLPVPVAYPPAPTRPHTVAPSVPTKEPGGHGSHTRVPSTAVARPTGQTTHALRAGVSAYEPAAQRVHAERLPPEKLPAGHARHVERPVAGP
jgi:hypothetical protein